MRKSGSLGLIILSMTILSYGLVGAVHAQEVTLPITVNTDFPSYGAGSIVTVSGEIKTLSEYAQPIVIQIITSDGSLASIAQIMPGDDGSYSASFTAGGTWKLNILEDYLAE